MALDKATADRLWNSRYFKELKDQSFKNKNMHETEDPDDMFGDMALHVWTKAVQAFDPSKTNFAGGDTDRAFNAFFHQILNQFLANQMAHRNTEKQKYIRTKQKSLDAPVKKDDEGDGSTLMELVEQTQDKSDPDVQRDIQNMLHALPKELGGALEYIIEHADRGNINKVMEDVREQFGFTRTRLLNALMEEPEFVDFIQAY